jgi:hypothetical protein
MFLLFSACSLQNPNRGAVQLAIQRWLTNNQLSSTGASNLSRSKSKEKLKGGEKAASSGNLLTNLRGGAMIMKSVSIFLASGRRASKVLTDKAMVAAKLKRANRLIYKIDEATGKIHPKFMDILRRKTQFSKWVFIILINSMEKFPINL